MSDSNIALLIDFENAGLDSMRSLVEQMSGVGRIIVKRAYADWSSQRKGQEQLIELGIEAVHNYRGPRAGKNSCDIKLTIDAVELLHSAQVDTFVIVSSDSDFVPLVNHLRGSGKQVIGAGREDVTSATMVKSCDRYIFLRNSDVDQRPPSTVRRRIPAKKRPASGLQNKDSEALSSLIIRAVEAATNDAGIVLGTKLAQTIQRIDPSFSYKEQGYRNFREFLEARNEVNVTLHQGTDFTVSLNTTANSKKPNNHNRTMHNGPQRLITFQPNKKLPDPIPKDWDNRVNEAWADRKKDQISGQSAASAAARILGFKRLRDTIYPTLDKLLASSKLLQSNWSRNKNYVEKTK